MIQNERRNKCLGAVCGRSGSHLCTLQLRSTSCSEFEDKAPLSTSTPIKQHAQVVAMSPKLAHAAPASPPAPVPAPTPAPAPAPAPADHKSHIPVSKERLKVQTDKYQKTDDSVKVGGTNYMTAIRAVLG